MLHLQCNAVTYIAMQIANTPLKRNSLQVLPAPQSTCAYGSLVYWQACCLSLRLCLLCLHSLQSLRSLQAQLLHHLHLWKGVYQQDMVCHGQRICYRAVVTRKDRWLGLGRLPPVRSQLLLTSDCDRGNRCSQENDIGRRAHLLAAGAWRRGHR